TATSTLMQVVEYDSNHELAPRSAYIAGWSAYSGEDYESARRALTRLRELGPSEEMGIEGRYLLSQVHIALEDYESAETELAGIYEAFPDSDYAPEALSAHADILWDQDRVDDAVDRYQRVFQRYPDHQLAAEALYKRGEVLFTDEQYERARDAWLEFRSEADEDHRLYAASLFRSGQASRELNQTGAALLVWNRLIDDFRDSGYRFDAMAGAAELYEQRGEFREALNLYTEIVGTYPELADQINARERADELVLRLGGLNEQEAALLVQIEQGRRAATEEGREAIIELSRLVIYESVAESVNRRLVLPLLRETASRRDQAPEQAAEAQFLIGEWFHQQEEYEDAAEAFLEAAGINPRDRDLSAQSLYRAVTSYRQKGDREAEIREIVTTMQDEFPGSEWTAEAETVLEAL
ncbi:MAG: tetratricopeptide repeat protein, partial [Spirochaetia bacterium]